MMTQNSYQTELELWMRVTYNMNGTLVRRLCVCVWHENDPLRARPDSVRSQKSQTTYLPLTLTLVSYPWSGRTLLEVTSSSLSSDALRSFVRSNISVSSIVLWDLFHRASQKYVPPSPKTQLELLWSMGIIYELGYDKMRSISLKVHSQNEYVKCNHTCVWLCGGASQMAPG